eukprot:jgi/Hompol1/6038/HPOL_004834-RA
MEVDSTPKDRQAQATDTKSVKLPKINKKQPGVEQRDVGVSSEQRKRGRESDDSSTGSDNKQTVAATKGSEPTASISTKRPKTEAVSPTKPTASAKSETASQATKSEPRAATTSSTPTQSSTPKPKPLQPPSTQTVTKISLAEYKARSHSQSPAVASISPEGQIATPVTMQSAPTPTSTAQITANRSNAAVEPAIAANSAKTIISQLPPMTGMSSADAWKSLGTAHRTLADN